MSYLEILSGLAAIVYLFYYFLTRNFDFWKVRGVVGPKPIPLFGNIKGVLFGEIAMGDYVTNLYKQYKSAGLVGIFFIRQPHLIVTDLDLIKDILIKDFSSFADRGLTFNDKVEPLSTNLVNLEPERWRPLRMRLSPIFTSGKLKDMFKMILECSENFEKTVAALAEKDKPINIHELTARFTTDVIGKCAFGVEAKALDEEESEFRRMGRKIFEPTGTAVLRFRFRELIPAIYHRSAFFLAERELTDFFTSVITHTMNHRREHKIYRNDFINMLLELQDNPEKLGKLKFTQEMVTAQAYVFFAAGFETSSTTMTTALYELALNQDVQAKLREEINETYRNNAGNLDYTTIKKMEYLDAVFRETLRKYPPVMYLTRRAGNSYTFEGTKVTIPKGQYIMIPAYAIHRDPSLYPNPDVFNPDRFRNGAAATRHPMSFLPFGDGPRNCIGARFAVYQTKIGLIKIIRSHNVIVCEETPIPFVNNPKTFLLAPTEKIHLKITKYTEE